MDAATGLATIAQIATAFLGFSGLITVFDSRPLNEWSRVDRLRLWFLLGSSALPLVMCFIGLILLSAGIEESIFSISLSVSTLLILGRWNYCGFSKVYAIPKEELLKEKWSPLIFNVFQSCVTVLIFAQLYNIFVLHSFWLPFALIITQLSTVVTQFIRVVASRNQ